jgi:predicted acyl esterase
MNGEGWHFEDEWPLSNQVLTEYYFNDNALLQTSQGMDGADFYEVDFTHDSRWQSSWGDYKRIFPIVERA